MMTVLGYVLLQLGCVCLSLVLPKHYRQFFADKKLTQKKKIAFNLVGYSLLVAGLCCFALDSRFSIALTTFFAVFTVCILAWSFFMAYHKQKTSRL